jgi:hypothetical protein
MTDQPIPSAVRLSLTCAPSIEALRRGLATIAELAANRPGPQDRRSDFGDRRLRPTSLCRAKSGARVSRDDREDRGTLPRSSFLSHQAIEDG